MRSACRRVGLAGVTFHTFRHTFASWSGQMSGVEALSIRDLLGHSSVTVTDRYMHSNLADIHDAVRRNEQFYFSPCKMKNWQIVDWLNQTDYMTLEA